MVPNSPDPVFDLFNDEKEIFTKFLAFSQSIDNDKISKKNLCQEQSFFELIKDNGYVFINFNRMEHCEDCNNVFEADFI